MSKTYFTPASKQKPKNVFSVHQLNQHVQQLFDVELPSVWVSGEISNFIHHSSGHMYFTLKDEHSQVKAAMFKGANSRLHFTPENGMQILAQAKVSLYAPRGDYQLVVSRMQKDGLGDLQQQFDALKNKLHAEGLFDPETKRALPKYSYTVGVVTSPTGAVLRDIRSVLQRRAPWIHIIVYPSKVQGSDAKDMLVEAIQTADARNEVDTLIIARGGGSLEDLWPFNEESVARAIAHCSLPTISAIGHETDFGITDFVADVRAPTPSAAAELVAPDQHELLQRLTYFDKHITHYGQRLIQQHNQKIDFLASRLISPDTLLKQKLSRISELEQRMHYTMTQRIMHLARQVTHTARQLSAYEPSKQLHAKTELLHQLNTRLFTSAHQQINARKNTLNALARTLNGVSPLATMERGFSVTRTKERAVILSAKTLSSGDTIITHFKDGDVSSRVD